MKSTEFIRTFGAAGILLLAVAACSTDESGAGSATPAKVVASEPADLGQLFEDIYTANLQRDPMTRESRGVKGVYDGWNDLSDGFKSESVALKRAQLKQLNQLALPADVAAGERVSLELLKYDLQQSLDEYEFRDHAYNVTQMYGDHLNPVNQLLSIHQIDSETGAQAYITRLERLPVYLGQLVDSLKASEAAGVIAPKFALEGGAAQIEGILTGKPFQAEAGNDSVLLASFSQKIAQLGLEDRVQAELNALASTALADAVYPAYRKLQAELARLSEVAQVNGVWALPRGDDYYNYLLKAYTTTDLSAEEIYQLGLSEVSRIHAELEQHIDDIGFDGDLQAFFAYTSTDEQFFFAEGEAGKAQAISDAQAYIDRASPLLETAFHTRPAAPVIVKPVEAYREAASPAAFYQPGTADGSRPGVYFVNTYNRQEIPSWQLPTITFHEAIPGHHLQVSIGQELTDLPTFRRFLYYTGHSEGWGMYSEQLAAEAGLYADAMEDYGRLVMELLRACRLVADTGIHYKRWTEEQAVNYLLDNMPINPERATRSVRRYFVLPGQATAYKIGMIKILELRERAEQALGSDFELADFHSVVLDQGMLPLSLLEQQVDDWLATAAATRGGRH